MKTNLVLLAAVLLILSTWGAAQFVAVDAQYYWRESPGHPWKEYKRGVRTNVLRGYIEVQTMADDNLLYAGEYRLVGLNLAAGPRFIGPRLWRMPSYVLVILPYWLLALPPALWLALRLYRARPNTRGFAVATSPPS